MSDLETRLRDHFADRTHDLSTTGPGLDVPGPASSTSVRSPRYAAIAFAAAVSVGLLGVGGLFLVGRDDVDSVSTAETGSPASPPDVESALQPVETLPESGDVSDTPVTVQATEPIDWYRVAPDLDISWYTDQGEPSFFCWRTPAVIEPQCSVDPLGGSVYPLVVPTGGAQVLVLAPVDRSEPLMSLILDDGLEVAVDADVDDVLDLGVARVALLPRSSIATVDGRPVAEPVTIDAYIPPFLEDFVGLDLEDFTDQTEAFGFTTRVVMEDGESLRVTADYRVDRVNVATVDGVVTEVLPVG